MADLIKIEEILEHLPHRYPMLLVDRIVEVSEDLKKIRGLKNVTINEPFFQGHYPGMPVMPGVLIMESMAQVGAVVMLMNPSFHGMVPLIGAIDGAKFKRMVVPGDQMVIDVDVLWIRGSIGRCRATASVDGEVAATMELTFKLSAKDR